MSTPPPGVDGYSEDPLQEYPRGDAYMQWRRATRPAREEARRVRRQEMREAAEKEVQASRNPAPEHLYALALGVCALGLGVLALAFLPLDIATFPLGIAIPLILWGGIGVIRDTRRKK